MSRFWRAGIVLVVLASCVVIASLYRYSTDKPEPISLNIRQLYSEWASKIANVHGADDNEVAREQLSNHLQILSNSSGVDDELAKFVEQNYSAKQRLAYFQGVVRAELLVIWARAGKEDRVVRLLSVVPFDRFGVVPVEYVLARSVPNDSMDSVAILLQAARMPLGLEVRRSLREVVRRMFRGVLTVDEGTSMQELELFFEQNRSTLKIDPEYARKLSDNDGIERPPPMLVRMP